MDQMINLLLKRGDTVTILQIRVSNLLFVKFTIFLTFGFTFKFHPTINGV